MIQLHELRFSKADLLRAPENERVLYVLLGGVANEMITLSKQLLFWTQPNPGEDEAEVYARTSAVLITARLLAGRTYEAWNVLRAREHSEVFKGYRDQFSAGTEEALRRLNQYFGRANLIERLRNKSAFHSDIETVRTALDGFPDDEPFVDYINNHVGNTFYSSAHLISTYGVMHLSKESDIATAMGKMADEVISISGLVSEYVFGFMAEFTIRHLDASSFTGKPVHTLKAPKLMEVTTPFFCEPPENS